MFREQREERLDGPLRIAGERRAHVSRGPPRVAVGQDVGGKRGERGVVTAEIISDDQPLTIPITGKRPGATELQNFANHASQIAAWILRRQTRSATTAALAAMRA